MGLARRPYHHRYYAVAWLEADSLYAVVVALLAGVGPDEEVVMAEKL